MTLSDAPEHVKLAYANVWGTMAANYRATGRWVEMLLDNPREIFERGDFVAFAYPGVLYGWSRGRRLAWEQRGGAVVVYREDGVVAWTVAGPIEPFLEISSGEHDPRPEWN